MSESDSSFGDSSDRNSEVVKTTSSRFEVTPAIEKEVIKIMDYSRRPSRGIILNNRDTRDSDHENIRNFRRSLSATASNTPNVPEKNLKYFLSTKEKVPHMDHYRTSVDFG